MRGNLETKSDLEISNLIMALPPEKRKELDRNTNDIVLNKHLCRFYGINPRNPDMNKARIISYKEMYYIRAN